MSWDVLIFDFKGPAVPVETMDKNYRPPVMGPTAEVRARISRQLPGVDWSDPTWGLYIGERFSIEFGMGRDPMTEALMLHVRGSGNALGAIMQFVIPNGWTAFDCTTGEYLDPHSPSEAGWLGFQAYRDRILEGPTHNEERSG